MGLRMNSISRYYSDDFIYEVISRVSSGELSVYGAGKIYGIGGKIYGIGGKMTIYRWLDCCNLRAIRDTRYRMVKKKKPLILLDKKTALKAAQLRLEYYETIFALAKEEYNVDFKKFWIRAIQILPKTEEIAFISYLREIWK